MESTKDQNFDLAAIIDYGVKAGIRDAILKHKAAGKSIVISKDDKIIEIPAEQIDVPEIIPPSNIDKQLL